MDFDISEITIKITLIYRTFNKESWDQKTKKYDYRYTD